MVRARRFLTTCITAALLLSLAGAMAMKRTAAAEVEARRRPIDPAAWGDDHVGQPPPAYMTGDECLFCHRDIGSTWGGNRHQLTIRPADANDPAVAMLGELEAAGELAAATQYLMGSRRITRFLKRSSQYGRLEMFSAAFVPSHTDRVDDANETPASHDSGELKNLDAPHWDQKTFADRCAGCHATAVDARTRAFAALSLDCFTCHGEVELAHTKDAALALLSDQNRESRQVVSLCGQCHLRGGTSRSTGLPYANNFVAGDNLFRDFAVDFSDTAIEAQAAIDRHLWIAARDVAIFDRQAMSCLTCHDVHGRSTDQHQQLEDAAICASCHVPGTDHAELREEILPRIRLQNHSRVCDY